MSAVCSICRREDRPAIEQSHVDGLSLCAIAAQHPGTTAWSLGRHFQHVPAIIEEQQKLQERRVQNDRATAKLPTRLEQLIAELERMTTNALRRKDYASALRSITARLQCLKTIGELTGELRGQGEYIPVGAAEPSAPRMSREEFFENFRALYGLPPRKPPQTKLCRVTVRAWSLRSSRL